MAEIAAYLVGVVMAAVTLYGAFLTGKAHGAVSLDCPRRHADEL